MLETLNSKFDEGDIATGAYTYASSGRTIIGRPSFINGVFNASNSVMVTGSNLAMEMMKNYDLDSNIGDRKYVGRGYKGNFAQFDFQIAPSYIWTLAEKYLGLTAGALDNVLAIAVSVEALALGAVVDLGVKLVDSSGKRGIEAQPLNKWGHECFRKCQLIGNSSLTTDNLLAMGFVDSSRKFPVAPAAITDDKIVVPVYDVNGAVIGYQTLVEGLAPSGGNFASGLLTVQTPSSDKVTQTFNGTLTVTLTRCNTRCNNLLYY